MKIGLISGEYPPMPGGVGDFTRILAHNLQQQGQDVFLLSRAGSADDGLPVSTVRGWGAGCLLQGRRWARRCGVDIVNLQFQTAAFDMSPFIHFAPDVIGAPVVTTFHDLRYPYLFPKAHPLRNWFVKRLARASAGAIATNREDEMTLQSIARCQMIPIGSSIRRRSLSPAQRADCRRQLGADDDCLLLGHFGFVRAIKGVDFLVDALASLRNRAKNARLVFIGERSNTLDDGADDRYLIKLDERIRQLGLQNAVHWTGFLPDDKVSAWLNAVDIMVLPYADGASFRRSSLVAALHQGCAVITTAPDHNEPSFVHGKNLWLTPPRSSKSIENALLHLLSHSEQVTELRAGAERLSREFGWERITRDTIAFFQSCL